METPKNPLVFQLTYEKCFTKALNQKGVHVNKPVPKLQGMQARTSKIAVKCSSHLKNSVSPGEQRQTGRKVHSSGSSMPSWNVYVGQTSGELQKHHSLFQRHERQTD